MKKVSFSFSQAAPVLAHGQATLLPSLVDAVRPLFLPAGYEDRTDIIDVSQWADFDFPRSISGKHDQDARWYTRLLNTAILDTSLTIGMKIDDDPTIVIDAGPVEARMSRWPSAWERSLPASASTGRS